MKSSTAANKRKPLAEKTSPHSSFPIVAIGASAGGLEAVTELLHNLPDDTGMSFIYVQHLSPDYKSMLTQLLSKTTKMKVQEVVNMVRLQPNNFYVVPPDKEMEVLDGRIKLIPRKKDRRGYLPIDSFFTSLAERHKESAVGVILSGSATDGTKGLKAIKSEGGLTFAQDESAKFNSMPKSAVAEGVVDLILPPKEIALEIGRLSKRINLNHDARRSEKEDAIPDHDPNLKTIYTLLFKSTGVDFSQYKSNTIKRRIQRRILLYKLNSIKDYAKLLEKKDKEIDILYQDLLINVTAFFRDTEAHRYLKATLFPKLLKSKAKGESLRIWVPACATGEEAYSMAMTLLELQNEKPNNIPVQIFATDLDEQAIQKARVGEYTKADVESVSPKRIQRFYNKVNNSYRITKAVRDMVVFAPHNVLRDPPFSRIDFISCCNLLIYLDNESQKTALTIFHYALNDGGHLMLGKSESIGIASHLFGLANKKLKIYSRKKFARGASPAILPFRYKVSSQSPAKANNQPIALEQPKPIDLDRAIDNILLAGYVPPSVVINYDLEIIQFRGSTTSYLNHNPGKASLNILKMARPEIAFELRTVIQKAIKTKQAVRKTGIETKDDHTVRVINVEAVPLKVDGSLPLLVVVFSENEQVEMFGGHLKGNKKTFALKDRRIKKLDEELAAAYAEMRSLTERHEASNEELQSANEEIVSSNEELQSVNEELETSQEEIESTNEELLTTNQELVTRNDLLTEAYEYSESIIATIHEPLLVLDNMLRVKTANRAFLRMFKVTQEETDGRLLYELGNGQWNIPVLRELLEDVIPKNNVLVDFEVTHTFPGIGEKTMLLNARLVQQRTHGQQMILLALSETRIGELRKLNTELEQKNLQLENTNKELQSFAYISSHDLQEPLRKIQVFASRLLEKEKNMSDEGKDAFRRMQDAAARMQTLIDDLLMYSRTNTLERKFEKALLSDVIDEVKEDMKEAIEAKGATIDVSKLCDLMVIRFQFKQLMGNLISNSLKFAKPDVPPHITIKDAIVSGRDLTQFNLSPNKKYCHIILSDNGIGFEPEYNKRIFEVFQRLHGRSEYPGTGIGLAICKKIVENHKGIIYAEGVPDVGATFHIYIPV